jgi:hypothetical protein
MEIRIEFNNAAFKHHIKPEDVLYAFEHCLYDHPVAGQEYKNLLLGLDRNLNLLEILYNEIDNNTVNIFHVDKCRPGWRNRVNTQEEEGA